MSVYMINKLKNNVLVSIFVVISSVLFVFATSTVSASTLTSASVTMTNSRMSFKAPVTSGAAGGSVVQISGAAPDTTTNHLFPGDKVCFTDAGNNVCRDNTTYTVDNIPDTTHFNISSPLTTALTATDYVVASQSGTWTITATTVNAVPIGGKLVVTIPANDANATAQNNDGMPDSAASIVLNGFDMNKMVVANATVTGGCTPANWGTAGVANSISLGGGGTTDTTITWNRATSTCPGGSALTISLAGSGIVNPAPITGHVQGNADVYGVTVATTDGTNTIDSAVPRAAPVEAVLISANVDESLSLVVGGITGATLYGNTWCGTIPSGSDAVTTTATSIPWGHIAASNHFYYAAQQLTVNTNANSGYSVTIQENDQMGRNGNVCTGTTPTVGDYNFSGATCIRDTTCSAATPCTETVMGDWSAATNFAGLGYSLASQSGTDAPFFLTQGSRTWNSKELPDIQGSKTAQTIMSNTGPVSGSSVYVCYKITVPGTQPSGYYYNIAKYTATATF